MRQSVPAEELAVGDVIEVTARDRKLIERPQKARIFEVQRSGKQVKVFVQIVGGSGMLAPVFGLREQVPRLSQGRASRTAAGAGKKTPPVTARGFVTELERRLRAASDEMTAAIRKQVYKPRPAEVVRLDVEVQAHTLARPLPILGYLMDAENDQVGGPIQFSKKRLFKTAELDRYTEADVETLRLQAPVLLEWFVGCWKRAGGTKYARAGTASLHAGKKRVDLRTLKSAR